MNRRSVSLLLIVSLALASSCTNTAEKEIGFGEFSGMTYTNDFFGMTMTLPDGWSIQSKQLIMQTFELGGEMMTGNDDNLKAMLNAAKLNIVPLFMVSQYEVGSPVDSNPNINAIAERLVLPGIKKPEDYFFHTRKMMQSTEMQVKFDEETSTANLGGQDFGVMSLEMSMLGQSMKQKHFVALKNGYVLQIVITYINEEELPLLEKTLQSLKFD